MEPVIIKRNDLTPVLNATLLDKEGSIVDVTSATINFHMKAGGASTLKIDAAASIVAATSGQVRYTWLSGDTDTAGNFEGEFEVTYSGGGIETFPTDGYIPIRIVPDLA